MSSLVPDLPSATTTAAATASPAPPTSQPSQPAATSSSGSDPALPLPLIISIAGGVLLLVLLIALTSFFIIRRRKRNHNVVVAQGSNLSSYRVIAQPFAVEYVPSEPTVAYGGDGRYATVDLARARREELQRVRLQQLQLQLRSRPLQFHGNRIAVRDEQHLGDEPFPLEDIVMQPLPEQNAGLTSRGTFIVPMQQHSTAEAAASFSSRAGNHIAPRARTAPLQISAVTPTPPPKNSHDSNHVSGPTAPVRRERGLYPPRHESALPLYGINLELASTSGKTLRGFSDLTVDEIGAFLHGVQVPDDFVILLKDSDIDGKRLVEMEVLDLEQLGVHEHIAIKILECRDEELKALRVT